MKEDTSAVVSIGNCVIDDVVLPGQIVKDEDLEKASNEKKMVLGPGLKRLGENVVVSKPGKLKKIKQMIYVDSLQKRYIPVKGEEVVGVVVKKMGDTYKVDIGSSDLANLSFLAFENATQKNKPVVVQGDVLYATLVTACPDMEPELVCVNSLGKARGLGILKGKGLLLTCGLHLCRKILNDKCKLLSTLGNTLKIEICIGMNGRIWIRGDTDNALIAANAILSAENLQLSEIHVVWKKLIATLRRK